MTTRKTCSDAHKSDLAAWIKEFNAGPLLISPCGKPVDCPYCKDVAGGKHDHKGKHHPERCDICQHFSSHPNCGDAICIVPYISPCYENGKQCGEQLQPVWLLASDCTDENLKKFKHSEHVDYLRAKLRGIKTIRTRIFCSKCLSS